MDPIIRTCSLSLATLALVLTPVVASAVGGLMDFMVDGRNGVLSPPQDASALAEQLGRLLAEPMFRQRLSQGARASVVQSYDEQIVLTRFAALLNVVAESGRRV